MAENNTFAKVVEIVMKYQKSDLTAEQIKPETTLLDDLQVNSARLVDIILDFEDEFDIAVDDEEADAVTTVQEAVDLVNAKLA